MTLKMLVERNAWDYIVAIGVIAMANTQTYDRSSPLSALAISRVFGKNGKMFSRLCYE